MAEKRSINTSKKTKRQLSLGTYKFYAIPWQILCNTMGNANYRGSQSSHLRLKERRGLVNTEIGERAMSCLSSVQGKKELNLTVQIFVRWCLSGGQRTFLKKMEEGYLTEFHKLLWQFWHFQTFSASLSTEKYLTFFLTSSASFINITLTVSIFSPVHFPSKFSWAKETRKKTVKTCMLITS